MFDFIKKSLFAGLGLAVVTKTKLETVMEKLVEEGKMSKEEAEKTLQDLLESGEKQWQDIEDKTRGMVKEMMDKMDFCRQKDLEQLTKKIKAVEVRLDDLEKKKSTKAKKQ